MRAYNAQLPNLPSRVIYMCAGRAGSSNSPAATHCGATEQVCKAASVLARGIYSPSLRGGRDGRLCQASAKQPRALIQQGWHGKGGAAHICATSGWHTRPRWHLVLDTALRYSCRAPWLCLEIILHKSTCIYSMYNREPNDMCAGVAFQSLSSRSDGSLNQPDPNPSQSSSAAALDPNLTAEGFRFVLKLRSSSTVN